MALIGYGNPKPADTSDAAWSVSDLTRQVAGAIRRGLPERVVVRGEISQINRATSGHRYFTLKDDAAVLDAKMWRAAASRLAFDPKVGAEVLATGRLEVYAPHGRYSLICESLEPVGQGALELAFRRLVEKLRAEGLFEPSRKRAIPDYPTRVCVVTSPQAAGYADVLKVLRPVRCVEVSLLPVPVQGASAAGKIAEAIDLVSAGHEAEGEIGRFDVVLLCRGGGSAEDLWSFNEEAVARAIFRCRVPVLTGIGHETDRSVADFVADAAAHTPTEAANRLVRLWKVAPERVEQLGVLLRREVRDGQRARRERLRNLARHELFRRPTDLVDRRRQRLDEQAARLAGALRRLARGTAARLAESARVLQTHHPRHRVAGARGRLAGLQIRLDAAFTAASRDRTRRLDEAATRLARAAGEPTRVGRRKLERVGDRLSLLSPARRLADLRRTTGRLASQVQAAARRSVAARRAAVGASGATLRALDPSAVVARGYSLTFRARDGRLVRAPGDVAAGDTLVTRTAGGEVRSTVGEVAQGSLF